jgi:hypothetical protein
LKNLNPEVSPIRIAYEHIASEETIKNSYIKTWTILRNN